MNTKKCGYCGEEIESGSRRCPHCGSVLEVKIDSFEDSKDELGNSPMEDDIPEEKNEEVEENDPGFNDFDEEPLEKVDLKETGQNSIYSTPNNASEREPMRQEFTYRPPVGNYGNASSNAHNSLSNGLKVFLTVICAVIPGLGQLAGIIIAIVYMNTQENVKDFADRRSFGLALLIASIVMFVLSCIGCFVLALGASAVRGY